MNFREHATAETSALVTRLLESWSDHSRRELESLRAALTAAAQATETALVDLRQDDATPALANVVEELSHAARLEVEAAVARVSADGVKKLEAVRKDLLAKQEELAKVAASLDTAQKEAAETRSQLGEQTQATEQARAEVTRLQQAHATLEADVKKIEHEAQQRFETMQRESRAQLEGAQKNAEARLKEAQDAAQALLEEAQQQAQAAIARAREEKQAFDKHFAEAVAETEQAKAELSDVTRQLETEAADRAKIAAVLGRAQSLGQNADTERKKMAQLLEAAEARALASERARTDLEQALEQARQAQPQSGDAPPIRVAAQPQSLDRLLNSFQKLEQSRNVRDVLGAIVDGLAGEFARVAAFEVNGNRLQGLRQLGFESERDMSKVAIPLSMESLLTEAVTTGRIQSLTGADITDASRKLFGGAPSFILVLPIAVGDDVLAVIYADDSDRSQDEPFVPQSHVKFAQLLLWHAVPRLPRLVREQRERAELQEYATLLVQQIQETYDADVRGGCKGDDLTKRVAENLKCAKDMFTSRAEVVEDAEALLEERISAVIEEARAVPFGKDLASAAGRTKAGRERTKQARQVS